MMTAERRKPRRPPRTIALVGAGGAMIAGAIVGIMHEDAPADEMTTGIGSAHVNMVGDAVSEPARSPAAPADSMRVTRKTDIRAANSSSAVVIGTLKAGSTVNATNVSDDEWTQIAYAGALYWVRSDDIADPAVVKAAERLDGLNDDVLEAATRESSDSDDSDEDSDGESDGESDGTTMEACSTDSDIESGLKPDTVRVYRSVCANFPGVSRYGGRRGGGEHATGRAVDIMLGDADGDAIAEYVLNHADELGVKYVIWEQQIWLNGHWRDMEDRGSPTQNHMDHVHVTTHGDRGTL